MMMQCKYVYNVSICQSKQILLTQKFFLFSGCACVLAHHQRPQNGKSGRGWYECFPPIGTMMGQPADSAENTMLLLFSTYHNHDSV